MTPRTFNVLEYHKILERVAAQCSFSAGRELAHALLPSDDLDTARERLAQTAEAFALLEQRNDVSFGGVGDVRPLLEKAARQAILFPQELQEIKSTLTRARTLRYTLIRLESTYPKLAAIAYNIEPCDHVVREIGRCINDRNEVVDAASPALSQIRQELRIAQDRLLSTLDRLVHNSDIQPHLQDSLVTQRQGRYVIPVRAESKGQIHGIVHDQSSSGATLFIEPLKVVEQNNAVRELELKEEKEVRRILTQLTELTSDEATYIHRNVDILAQLDFTFAKARYASVIEATAPELLPFKTIKPKQNKGKPKQSKAQPNGEEAGHPRLKAKNSPLMHPGSIVDLRHARHPLLDPDQVVPIDIYLDDETYQIVITGPNTGGKTVTLKTVGLFALMAQSGLMIPVEPGSRLTVFEGIFADIGDEQSIEQNLSTFSSHMTNIISILEETDPHSMVLLDELGAGTDPDEGSALAMALLDNLRDRGITTFATTHYSDLKLYAHNTPGVRNASVEFDVQTLSPTYELSIGLPGRSNALTIARRLGLNPTIVDKAEKIVRPDALEADSMLEDIRRVKQDTMQIEQRAKERERQAQLIETDLRHQLAKIEEARRVVIAETRETMQAELKEARKEIERFRRRMASGGTSPSPFTAPNDTHAQFIAQAEETLARRQYDDEVERAVVLPGSATDKLKGPIEVGDLVWVASLQTSGKILTIHEKSQEADVQLGNFRLKLPLKRLELRKKAETETQVEIGSIQRAAKHKMVQDRPVPKIELDLRGTRVEVGLEKLERYLDDAHMGRLPWVRIIHGKGTGAMRDAVRSLLKRHALVSKFRFGESGEGGDGVTIANLADN